MSKSLASIIAHVELINFLSYECAGIEFKPGTTLIEGFNFDDGTPEGSGKSAIPNAVCWGLFGKLPKEAKVDDVVREGADSCSVVVTLRDGSEVHRTRKPNDLFLQVKGGEQVRGKDARETQALIEKHLGMSFEGFCQAVYFAQNYPHKFISATEAERAAIISEIQDLEDFDAARKKVQGLLKAEEVAFESLRKEVESQTQLLAQAERQCEEFSHLRDTFLAEQKRKVESLTLQLRTSEEAFDDLQHDLNVLEKAQLEERAASLKTDIAALQEQLSAVKVELGTHKEVERQRDLLRSDLKRKADELARLDVEMANLADDLKRAKPERAEAEEQELTQDLEQLEDARSGLRAEILSLQDQSKVASRLKTQLERKHADLGVIIKKLSAFKASTAKKCPTCGAEMSSEHAGAHLASLAEEKAQAVKEVEELEGQLKEAGEQRSDRDLKEQLAELEAGIQVAKSRKAMLEKARRALDLSRRNLEVLQARHCTLIRESDLLQSRLDAIQLRDATELTEQAAELQEALVAAQGLLESTQKDLIQARDVENRLSAQAKEIAQLGRLLKDAQARDTGMMDEKIDALTAEISKRKVTLSTASSSLENSRLQVARYATLKDAYQEVKQYVFRGLLAELTKKANKYLVDLFEVPVSIKFTNEGEDGEASKIQVSVSLDGHERPLGLYSGGQFRRISLAVDLALSEIISGRSHNPANLRVFDEPFKDLSEVSMEKALRLFESLQGCTVLIEHNSMVKSIVSNSYRVELRDGVSRVVE